MPDANGRQAVSGVGLIVLCFLGSAALRLAESGVAIAEEIGAMASLSGGADETLQCLPTAESDALLTAIRERESQLADEQVRLADRAQTLRVAETKLAEQLAAFETAQKNLEDTLAIADKAAERDIERMTAVYESMKPSDSARIFERMDVAFAAGLLARMRPESAAAVLTGMNPDAAYAVTVTIASRNAGVPTE
jgi:flagellar motility protein MotE (MotC chaperone)